MMSLFGRARWCAPLVAVGLALAAAPYADAAPPDVHPNNGTYASQTPITISFVSAEPVTIHYTTDGSTPGASSPVYSAPLTFTTTTVLKWVATAADDGDTASGEETYT